LKLLPFGERVNWMAIDIEQRSNYYLFFDQFINEPTGEEVAVLKQMQAGV
jgi:hypothetical protein